MAARISQGCDLSESWKAWALPWKLPTTLSGMATAIAQEDVLEQQKVLGILAKPVKEESLLQIMQAAFGGALFGQAVTPKAASGAPACKLNILLAEDVEINQMVAVELITAVDQRFGINLPVMALSEGPTIAKLSERIILQLKGGDAAVPDDVDMTSQVKAIAEQHGSEINADAIDRIADSIAQEKH